jgi:hypothetical protein
LQSASKDTDKGSSQAEKQEDARASTSEGISIDLNEEQEENLFDSMHVN